MSDLLKRIQDGIDTGDAENRKALLIEALERINQMNSEYDAMCTERGRVNEALTEIADNGNGEAQALALKTLGRV